MEGKDSLGVANRNRIKDIALRRIRIKGKDNPAAPGKSLIQGMGLHPRRILMPHHSRDHTALHLPNTVLLLTSRVATVMRLRSRHHARSGKRSRNSPINILKYSPN